MAEDTDTTKKRPRLDLDGGRERKRGKSMFGLVIGTLNKAKIEDKERSASEAAKKRQMIEQRLQTKLRKETDSVRRAEEAKKDKMAANRKEEDLQLQDSIYKFRRTRLPLYANFLLTSDVIPEELDGDNTPSNSNPNPNVLAHPPRTHPPPLYYLPAVLLPSQDSFLAQRKRDTISASTHEYTLFCEERVRGIEAVNALRQRVADEEAKSRSEVAVDTPSDDNKMQTQDDADAAAHHHESVLVPASSSEPTPHAPQSEPTPAEAEFKHPSAMDVDPKDEHNNNNKTFSHQQEEKKEDQLGGDEDEAVEY